MKIKYKSISYRLLSILLLAASISMGIYCVFFYTNMHNSTEKRYLRQTQSTWDIAAHNIDHSISTCIDVANKGIYMNMSLQELLFSRDPSIFSYTESANSSLMFSYMMNIYSVTPEAVQVRLAAYKSEKSLLLTTGNLQRYLKKCEFTEDETTPPVSRFRAYILPPHMPNSYGHQLNHLPSSSQSPSTFTHSGQEGQVFTICLPLYHLPHPGHPIGELYVDVSVDLLDKLCGYLYDNTEEFYILDKSGNIFYSSDPDLIGTKTATEWLKVICQEADAAKEDSYFVSQKTNRDLHTCQKIISSDLEWYMVKSIPKSLIHKETNTQLATLILAYAVCMILATLVDALSILRYTQPLKKASEYMNSINAQNMNSRLSDYVAYHNQDEIGLLFHSLDDMMDTINNFVIRQYELDIINRTTELKILEAQIKPHFIYNTLQCLATKSLEHHDKEQYDYISSFGQLLQYSMDTEHTLVHLEEEMNHVNRYITLQKMRFPNQLSVQWNISPSIGTIIVPKMILQPLIENSFKHGNLLKKSHGHLTIGASIKANDYLFIYVSDNGHAPDEEQITQINLSLQRLKSIFINRMFTPHHFSTLENGSADESASPKTAAGELFKDSNLDILSPYAANNIGLSNVLLRLLLNFGRECDLTIYANQEGGTTVSLLITYKTLWNSHLSQKSHNKEDPL